MGTKALFKNLNLTINAGDRIGLVGHNGSGKSTLLSILSGLLEPDEGDLARNRDLQLETVEQFIRPELNSMGLLEALVEKLPAAERPSEQYRAEQLLGELGFSESDYNYLVGDLSGGQQNRLMFARAMINEPNVILLDEPTNHLDLRTLLTFEHYLTAISAAFLIISHDRQFLDSVTTRTVFLRDERIYNFDLPYSEALAALEEQDAAAQAAREQEEKNIKRLEASATRLAMWGKVYDNEKISRKAKNMEKRIEKLKDDKTFVTRGSGLNLTLDVGSAQANRMLHIENQDIAAPDGKALFHIEDFMIRPG
jgi:ATPase subunit of ABC transporter with duplicated ATPase domains